MKSLRFRSLWGGGLVIGIALLFLSILFSILTFNVSAAPNDNSYQVPPFSQDWSNTNLITADDDWAGVPGIIGYRGDNLVGSTGVDPQTIVADGTTTPVDIIANQNNPDTLTSGGIAEFEITDSVVALQGSGTADAPFLIIHLDTTGLSNIQVAYNLRDIDSSSDDAVQAVALQYRVGNSGDFTNLPAGFVADATTGPNLATQVTPVAVTLPADADNQAMVQVRIITANAVGSDEWVGVDDLTITSSTAAPSLSISKHVTPDTAVAYHGAVTYTITLTNSGTVSDSNVLLTDTLPVSTTFASWITQPAGATVIGDEVTWSGTISDNATIALAFLVTHTGDYGDVVENTAVYSGTGSSGNASATFSVIALDGDITFVYHDLEDVVHSGEAVYLAGDFTDWLTNSIPLAADASFEVFSVTVPSLASNTYDYKYIVYTDTVPTGPEHWEWLNTNNRTYTVVGTAAVNDYRNVVVGWANLQWPPTLETDMGVATTDVYGRLYISNVTNTPGTEGRGLQAEVGFGDTTDLTAWDWFPMAFNADDGTNNDEFVGVMTPTLPGVYSYTTRYDGNWGAGNPNAAWTYGDLNGIPFELSQTGVMTVNLVSVPIATVRAGTLGETFAVSGTVTYVPGTFNSTGWALQDASGGIGVFDNALIPTVNYGDSVQMIANRGANGSEEQLIAISYYNNLGPGSEVTPVSYTTGDILAGNAEGWIVEIQGTISGLTACSSNYSFFVDDGTGPVTVFVDTDTGVNVCNIGGANGEEIHVVGFATQFGTLNEVKPRRPSDVQVLLNAPIVVDTTPANNATNVLTDTLITIQFNEPVTITADWYTINCSISGDMTGTTSPASPSATYTITPTTSFANGDLCNVTVLADQVTNSDGQSMAADYPFSFSVGTISFGVCGDPAMPIHFVQGNGTTSPLAGSSVFVEGVVVGDFQDTLNGFYIQEENADFDADPMTSEGIFVYDPDGNPAVSNGDKVRLEATVSEFRGLTELGSMTNFSACGTDTITPTMVTLPLDTANDWEFYEGMLIAITEDLTVTNNYYLGRFGQIRLSIDARLAQPTNVVLPGAPANALQELNNRSYVTLDDASSVQNPDPIVYPDPQLTFTNTLRGGDLVAGGIIGVVDHYNNDSSDDYRVHPTTPVTFTHTNTRPTTTVDVGGTIQVASANLLNYFVTIDNGTPICGPTGGMDCRGADSAIEFTRQRDKIINALVTLDADVIGIMEMENHPTDDALQNLVQGLNDATSAGTYAYIDTGTIGTDAIKVGLIYKPAMATPIGDYVILDSSVDPTFLDTKNRPVLIQTFAENTTGQRFTVAVNHLKSKGSDCNDVGDPDTGDGQGNCNLTRTSAATALVNYLATNPTNSGSSRFLIIGDLNSYALEDPISAIKAAGYTDLINRFQGTDAYGYTFDGQWGYLDHALASSALTPFVTGTAEWHINSDEPVSLDYNMEFKTANQQMILYGDAPYRASDHDPVLIGLAFPTVSIVSPMNGDVFTGTNGAGVSIPVTITTTDFTIPDDGHWHLWVDGSMIGPVLDYSGTVDLAVGTHVISAELRTPDHVSLGIADTVTVTVNTTTMTTPTVSIVSPMNGDVFTGTNGTAVSVPVTITTTNFTIPDDGHWHLWVDGSMIGPVLDYNTTVDLAVGTHVISAELRTPDHISLGVVDTVTVTVNTLYTGYLPIITTPGTTSLQVESSLPLAARPVASGIHLRQSVL